LVNGGARVVALADLFADRLAETREKLDALAVEKGLPKTVDPALMFQGPDAYHRLLAAPLDAVLITSPPYFHPEHFEAAVAAGKHVYLEKPVATDVAGALRVIKAGKQANGKVCVHVGFQKRYDEGYRAVMEKIHAGEIGEIVLGQTFYYTNDLDRREKG